MSNVNDIDLDVDLDDVEGGEDFTINVGRYLFKLDSMEVRETKGGRCFMYEALVVDTQVAKNEKCIGRRVYEIANIEPDSKQFWKVKMLVKGGFGIDKGKKIPGEILGKHFVATVYEEEYNGKTETKIHKHTTAASWEGLNAVVDDEGNVTITNKPNGAEKKSSSKSKSKKSAPADAGDFADDDIEF
jgi:hypothetical protein